MSSKVGTASSDIQELYQLAKEVREFSYSPYSGYKVGAAIRLSNGQTFTGCNVENSSFGATVCAERTAILKAISEKGRVRVQEVMVVTEATPPWPPCGMCRQVMSEFGDEIKIYIANLGGDLEITTLQEIFPKAFHPAYLDK